MANILSEAKKHQVIALGRLGWTLRRIEAATGVRRETASRYLRAAGVTVRPPGRWGHPPANPAKEVSTDSGLPSAAPVAASTWPPAPQRAPAASACEPYRELIELAVARGRDAMAIWRDLVDDHALNPLYRDVLAHYGVVALPCRVADPDRKGKVESAIGHTQRAVKGLRFETLDEAQAYLDRWDARWADTRIHGTTKRQVAAMFAEERPTLQPLPVEPFRYYQFGTRTVHLDNCIEVDYAYYSAPRSEEHTSELQSPQYL